MWLAVAGAFLWGLYQVITRRVAALDPPDVTVSFTRPGWPAAIVHGRPTSWSTPPVAQVIR